MALDSLGIAVIPPSIVTAESADGRLVDLDIFPKLPDLQFVADWLGTPDRRTLEEVVEIAFLAVEATVDRSDEPSGNDGRGINGRGINGPVHS
ncbi:hypothetical protein [Rhizobium acidisoli]|uniref:hypothetical protein n=1 Tax=Rhizobium acidisoli TaxID=1538158 RepID=UPI0006BA180E|nr:hypothetical protein [Rhizobium acidisoli]KPH04807.1 hypothetical protein AOG23_30925 [Rhizobium acidisoli]